MPPKRAAVPPEDPKTLERLIFFSDGVFAIAITLLVLDIRLPAAGLSNEALAAALVGIWHKYLAYFVSFMVIGMFWLGHVRRFRYVRRTNGTLMVLNLLLLMSIAFIPFPTAVMSESGNRTSTITYALAILVSGLLSTSILRYSAGGGRLLGPNVPAGYLHHETLRSLVVPLVFLLSIPVAFIDADLAKYSWILILPALMLLR